MEAVMGEKMILTTKEAAELLGVSTFTIYGYVKDGRLRSARPGARELKRHRHGGAPHRFLRTDVLRLATPEPEPDSSSAQPATDTDTEAKS